MLYGSEKNYRNAVRKFIDENIGSSIINHLFDKKSKFIIEVIGNKKQENIYSIIDQNILKRVMTCFFSIKNEKISMLTENSYIGLILHTTIAINRILKNEIIESNDDFINKLKKDENYKIAREITSSIEKEFQIDIPEIETAYICLHLKGSKLQHINNNGEEQLKDNILDFVNAMIDTYDKNFAYELKQDEDFINGLIAHLKPTFIRLKNNMSISNPLLEEIKENYSEIYSKCENVGRLIEKKINCKIPDTEIGFLAIHFGAAVYRIESKMKRKRKVNIGVICASGIGISRLMCTRLKGFLKSRAELTTYGRDDITEYVKEKNDFFISSIELNNLHLDIVKVNPLLTENDLIEIDKKVDYYENIPLSGQREEYTEKKIKDINFISYSILMLIKNFSYIKVYNEISFDELVIAISEKVTPYYEKRYIIQRDIQRREKISSQVMPELGFALLHCITDGISEPVFSVCFTNDRGKFLNSYFKSINTIVIMLIPNNQHKKDNTEILGFVSESLVENKEFLNAILFGSSEQIKFYFVNILNEYFNSVQQNFLNN